jgi:hypothetical protein
MVSPILLLPKLGAVLARGDEKKENVLHYVQSVKALTHQVWVLLD